MTNPPIKSLDGSSSPLPELPKPQRFLSADEAVVFLGLRSKSALAYLHGQPDPPPYLQLTKRRRVYCLADLLAWAEARKTAKQ